MATVEKPPISEKSAAPPEGPSLCDPEGFPWLENGERLDQKTFHERYQKTPSGFQAERIGGVVYVMASPLKNQHGRSDARASAWLFHYCMETPGTEVQNNTTTILGDASEPRPDSALLILPEYGGQSSEGHEDFTYGAPELIVEAAFSSRSIDLSEKLRDYERAGVCEYVVFELRGKSVRWFSLHEGRFVPLSADSDGLFRSRVFPGLRLDAEALWRNDKRALIATLQRGLASPEHEAFVAALERRRASRSESS